MLTMQNVVVDPKFSTLLFDHFRTVKLVSTSFIQRREVWKSRSVDQLSLHAGRAVTVPGYGVMQTMAQLQHMESMIRVLVPALQSLLYNKTSEAGQVQPTVTVVHHDVQVRVSQAWLRPEALHCIAPDLSASDIAHLQKTTLTEYNFVDLGPLPCPTHVAFACLLRELGDVAMANHTALRCDFSLEVWYNHDSDMSSMIHDVVAKASTAITVSAPSSIPVELLQHWGLSFDYATMQEQAMQVQDRLQQHALDFPDTTVLRDSGLQTMFFWVVDFVHGDADGPDSDWSALLLAHNFTDVSVLWPAADKFSQRLSALTSMMILGHPVRHSWAPESTDIHLLALPTLNSTQTTVSLTVMDYPVGKHDLEMMSTTLCNFANCDACNVTSEDATLAYRTTQEHSMLSSEEIRALLLTHNASCNSTASHARSISSAAEVTDDSAISFTQIIRATFPLAPSVVEMFLVEIFMHSISTQVNVSNFQVHEADEGAMAEVWVHYPDATACINTVVVSQESVDALFAIIWPYLSMPATGISVTQQCLATTTTLSVGLEGQVLQDAVAQVNNHTYSCVLTRELQTVLPWTQEEAFNTIQGDTPHADMVSATTASLTFIATCNSETFVDAFEHVKVGDFQPSQSTLTQAHALFFESGYGWNAEEKTVCQQGSLRNGCQRRSSLHVKQYETQSCLELTSANHFVSQNRFQAAIAANSPNLLVGGSDSIHVASSLSSSLLWVNQADWNMMQEMVTGILNKTSASVQFEEGVLLRHRFRLPWNPDMTGSMQHIHRQFASMALTLNGPRTLTTKSVGAFCMFTTTSLQVDTNEAVSVEVDLQLISMMLHDLHLNLFHVTSLAPHTFADMENACKLSPTEKLTIDHADKERILMVNVTSEFNCSRVMKSLRANSHLPLPLVNAKLRLAVQSFTCAGEVDAVYHAPSCHDKDNMNVFNISIANETCESIGPAIGARLHATEITDFVQTLNIFAQVIPIETIAFTHQLAACYDNNQDSTIFVKTHEYFGRL
jgi:hypothetical protein